MPGPDRSELANLPKGCPPLLLVLVDTEEEFDWQRPHSRANTSVRSVSAQARGQEILARYDIIPTYVVDFPVASDDGAVKALRELSDRRACQIGAHLHPWVNPPYEEEVNAYNSYPGNLPPHLEREKLARLTDRIAQSFDTRPIVYRAGRYGLGPATARILEDLGYLIDSSVVPYTRFTDDGGPDFEGRGWQPFWFGPKNQMLEVPLSCGFHGLLKSSGRSLYPVLTRRFGMRARLPGAFSRLGLLERIRLTPEGIEFKALVRLTESLLAQGCRVFCLSYHSPSLEPGHTPYVRDRQDLRDFLATIDRYLHYFTRLKGGTPTTPSGLYRLLKPATAETDPVTPNGAPAAGAAS